MRGREISSAYDFAVLASGVLLVPTALALIGRSSGESSGGSANAESLSVLLEVEMQQNPERTFLSTT